MLALLSSLVIAAGATGAPGDATATQVADINAAGNSVPAGLFNAGGTLLFQANDGTGGGEELWKSNGGPLGPGGTEKIAEIQPGAMGSNPTNFASVGDTVFFQANDGSGGGMGEHGREMWKVEPPYTTPVMVEDINATANGASSSPEQFTNVNGTVFFVASDGVTGDELWKSEPPYDAASTSQAADINPLAGSSTPTLLTNVNGTLMFVAADNGSDNELWKSNGIATTKVEDISADPNGSNPDFLTNVNGTLFFSADDGATNGRELWKSEGPGYDNTTTDVVENIAAAGADSDPSHLTNAGGTLFFQADDSGANANEELWKSSAPFTASETEVIDINPGGGSSPQNLVSIGGILYFRASDGMNGSELWRSNGGPLNAGTDLVANINPTGSSNPTELTGVGGQVFFAAIQSGINNRELWRTTGVGATLVADVNNNPATSSQPQALTDVNGTLFFRANDGVTGVELWKATIEGPAAPVAPITPITPVAPAEPAPKKAKCKKKKKGKKGAAAAKKCKKKRKKK